jgi:excisionase family DNA binding protein
MLVKKCEIARALQVSLRSVDNLIRDRRIPVVRIKPRLVRFDLLKVQRALEKYEVREVGRRLD